METKAARTSKRHKLLVVATANETPARLSEDMQGLGVVSEHATVIAPNRLSDEAAHHTSLYHRGHAGLYQAAGLGVF